MTVEQLRLISLEGSNDPVDWLIAADIYEEAGNEDKSYFYRRRNVWYTTLVERLWYAIASNTYNVYIDTEFVANQEDSESKVFIVRTVLTRLSDQVLQTSLYTKEKLNDVPNDTTFWAKPLEASLGEFEVHRINLGPKRPRKITKELTERINSRALGIVELFEFDLMRPSAETTGR